MKIQIITVYYGVPGLSSLSGVNEIVRLKITLRFQMREKEFN